MNAASMNRAVGSTIDLLRRTGVLDPTRAGAAAFGVTRWGPSLAAGVAASGLRRRNHAAVIDTERVITWGELDLRTTDLARGLKRRGLGRGTPVGVLCRNHIGFVEIAVAAAKAGLVPVYLNTGSAPAQRRAVVEREAVEALIGDADLLTGVAVDGPIIAIGSEWDAVAAEGHGRWDPLLPTTAAPVLMTSGTTGTPKGARRSIGLSASAGGFGLLDRVPYRADDVFVIPTPLFHAWGLANLTVALALGATVVLPASAEPRVIADAVDDHDGSVLVVVPILLQRMLAAAEIGDDDLTELRIVASSGSALPAPVALDWMDRFGDHLYNLYGSTEVGQATLASPADLRAAPGTAGRPLPGSRVRVIGDRDRDVSPGTSGRIFVASGNAFDHYTGGGGKQRIGDFLATGDVGHLDESGRLFVTGRADDMIVSGGENVFPGPVEDLLLEHPQIIDVAVVGVPDDEFGQRLKAVVVKRGRLSQKAVREHVSASLGRHYVPRDVEFVDELPRTTTGKVKRRELG